MLGQLKMYDVLLAHSWWRHIIFKKVSEIEHEKLKLEHKSEKNENPKGSKRVDSNYLENTHTACYSSILDLGHKDLDFR